MQTSSTQYLRTSTIPLITLKYIYYFFSLSFITVMFLVVFYCSVLVTVRMRSQTLDRVTAVWRSTLPTSSGIGLRWYPLRLTLTVTYCLWTTETPSLFPSQTCTPRHPASSRFLLRPSSAPYSVSRPLKVCPIVKLINYPKSLDWVLLSLMIARS